MTKKPSQKQIELRARNYVLVLFLVTAALASLTHYFSDTKDEYLLGLFVISTTFSATAMYFTAQNHAQSLFSAIVACGISVYILFAFPEQSKSIPFFAAAKQFTMVLYAGAVCYVFGTTLSSRLWQKKHPILTWVLALLPLGVPFITGLNKWKYQDGFVDICAIFAASTFGTIYLKEVIAKKSRNEKKRK